MKKGKNSAEKLLEEIIKLDPVQFIGVCKILDVPIYNDKVQGEENGKVEMEVSARDFEELWEDLCDKIENLNRTRRRNLGKLIYAATKKEKEN